MGLTPRLQIVARQDDPVGSIRVVDGSDMPAIRSHDFHVPQNIWRQVISFERDKFLECRVRDNPNQITYLKRRRHQDDRQRLVSARSLSDSGTNPRQNDCWNENEHVEAQTKRHTD